MLPICLGRFVGALRRSHHTSGVVAVAISRTVTRHKDVSELVGGNREEVHRPELGAICEGLPRDLDEVPPCNRETAAPQVVHPLHPHEAGGDNEELPVAEPIPSLYGADNRKVGIARDLDGSAAGHEEEREDDEGFHVFHTALMESI